MNSRSGEYEPEVVRGELGGDGSRRQRLPDAHYRDRARIAGARNYRVAVTGERVVREVGVAVDEG